jgi:hypothetical protein
MKLWFPSPLAVMTRVSPSQIHLEMYEPLQCPFPNPISSETYLCVPRFLNLSLVLCFYLTLPCQKPSRVEQASPPPRLSPGWEKNLGPHASHCFLFPLPRRLPTWPQRLGDRESVSRRGLIVYIWTSLSSSHVQPTIPK